MITLRIGGIIVAAFVAGSFIASPELRAYAANTVFSTDIKDGEVKTPDLANNAVTSAKIKDGEVKSAEIATDAVGADEIAKDVVGASEIKGVDKLIFADCITKSFFGDIPPLTKFQYSCEVPGIDAEDDVIVTDNKQDCFAIEGADTQTNNFVVLFFHNVCNVAMDRAGIHVSIMVYDELPDKVLP